MNGPNILMWNLLWQGWWENGNAQCTRAAASHDCSTDAAADDNVDAADVVVVIVIVFTAVAPAAGNGAAN